MSKQLFAACAAPAQPTLKLNTCLPLLHPPQLAGAKGKPRRSFLLASLFNTGSMWGLTGAAADAPAPLLAAALTDRGADVASPPAGAALRQPEGGAALPVGGLPAGFFGGRVSAAGGLGGRFK